MVKYDASSGFGGAVSGATTGFTFGGPPGALVGGTIGALSGFFGNKKKKKKKPISAFDPQQTELYNNYVNSIKGQGPFSDLYNFDADAANQNFDQMYSRPAYRSFEENIIPKITGQFRQGNIQNSSYLAKDLSRAGRDVQEGLDAHRSNMIYQGSQDAVNRKQNAIDKILGSTTFDHQRQDTQNPSIIDQILNTVGPAAGEWFSDYMNKGKNRGISGSGNSSPYSFSPSSSQNYGNMLNQAQNFRI